MVGRISQFNKIMQSSQLGILRSNLTKYYIAINMFSYKKRTKKIQHISLTRNKNIYIIKCLYTLFTIKPTTIFITRTI